jgi:sugar lactone lactonase YvrE/lysophospholipase L1-like esterase
MTVLNPVPLHAIHEGKLQVLLVGDSTTEAKIPKMLRPAGPHFEDVIQMLLSAEEGVPPVNVVNLGLSGEYIRRLLDSGRYDKEIKPVPGADYILIRYGLNDVGRLKDFEKEFPADYHELVTRLKQDHPGAKLVVMTVIPYSDAARVERVNVMNRQVAEAEGLPLFDIHPRYAAELEKGPNMLNYRRYPLAKIPAKYHALVAPFVSGKEPTVIVLDHQLDAHLGDLPGWYGDRHPNHAGYHVIADETAKYLAPLIRKSQESGENKAKAKVEAKAPLQAATPLTEVNGFTSGIEGPACDHAGNIYAVNFQEQGTIGRVTPDGRAELFVKLPEGSTGNGIRFSRDGRTLFVADYTGHNVLKIDVATRNISVLVHEPGMNQPNDLAITESGELYASDPAWKDGTGQLWLVNLKGEAIKLAEGMGTTNGVEVSPDGKTVYVNESVQRNLWAFDRQADGRLAGKRLVKQFPDHGFDGMRCDVAGNLYITRHGKGTVAKVSPEGEVLQEFDVLGPSPTNLCFGGPDGQTVYVTEAGQRRIVSFRVTEPGLEWARRSPAKTP